MASVKLDTSNKFNTQHNYISLVQAIYRFKICKLDNTASAYCKINDVHIPANSEMSYNFNIPLNLNNPGNYYPLIVDSDNGNTANETNLNYTVYCLLGFIIVSLVLYILKKPANNIELKNKKMNSEIDQLISKDKIETALEKLLARVKHNDEKLRSEILLLSNSLYSCNRDRLNGILPEEDYSIKKNKIVSRAIDISCELQLA